MSTGQAGSDPTGGGAQQPSEEQLRAAYEAEMKKIRVEQIMLEQVVTLINLGMRRTGLAPGTEDERDLGQVRLAIEAIRLQLPLIEQVAAAQAGPIRDALSQLQMAFVRLGGSPGEEHGAGGTGEPAAAPPPAPGEAGAPPPPDREPAGQAPAPGPSPADPAAQPPGPEGQPGEPGEPGPAQRSGRLWIPGQ